MEGRERLRFIHFLEAIALAVLAGVFVALLRLLLHDKFDSLADQLVRLGQYWIGGLLILILACLGVVLPKTLIPMVGSLRRLRVHCGILAKTTVGSATYLLVLLTWPHTLEYPKGAYICATLLLLLCCTAGLASAYILTRLFTKVRVDHVGVQLQPSQKDGLDAWLIDDQPIAVESESLFPAHSQVARRILDKLFSEPSETAHILPNVALIGPYGSGKTSICNLVETFYRQDEKKSGRPETVFCRFEAWQFLSAEACVGGLIEVVADRIQELVDVAALWRLPEKYVEAIRSSGGWWVGLAGTLLGRDRDTQGIIAAVGDTLFRLDVRLIIFVDDFDRIEGDSSSTQQAIAKALNQLQNLRNVQYVICVGPTNSKEAPGAGKHSWDLLKLTRFQELVPEVDGAQVVELTGQLRKRASVDQDYYLPCFERKEAERDQLTWNPVLDGMYPHFGISGKLIRLVNTPRTLKCMLRESNQAWEGGLKGEIDWHDLILANALRTAEPGVFEWIARDRGIFTQESVPLLLPPSPTSDTQYQAQEAKERKYAEELSIRLRDCIENKDPARFPLVAEVVCDLFPVFRDKLKIGVHSARPVPTWSQKIALRVNHGADYIERFFAGCVPGGDTADQPTLRYIRRMTEAGEFSASEFRSMYLDSTEKLTGALNKLVQFSGLVPISLAYRICETILDWIADPKHGASWRDPERFMLDVLPDVFAILENAGERQRATMSPSKAFADERERWLVGTVQSHAQKTPLLATFIVGEARNKAYKGAEALPDHIIRLFNEVFVVQKKPLLPSLGPPRFALAWLLNALSEYQGYEELKAKFTEKSIAEADNETTTEFKERIVFSLVAATTPVRDRPLTADQYSFSVDLAANEQRYDMNLMTEALRRWESVTWSDAISQKAFAKLMGAYNAN